MRVRGNWSVGPLRRCAIRYRAFSIVELIVSMAIIGVLLALAAPGLRRARAAASGAACTSNLRSAGQAIQSFATSNRDFVAPCIRQRDYDWSRGPQIGWDIETGRHVGVVGGPGTVWQCPAGRRAYVGNSRALGLDDRHITPPGPLWLVSPSRWHQASRLIVAYDVQPDIIRFLFVGANTPTIGDLSDEMDGRWPRDVLAPLIGAALGPNGPHHAGRFGVQFADGHAELGTFDKTSDAVFWSGPRWWPDLP